MPLLSGFPFLSSLLTILASTMDTTITYDTIVGLLANLPSIDPCPNFFNLGNLRTHFSLALKKIPCPQSSVNGWAGAVLSPAMYALINPTPFHWNITTTPVSEFPLRYAATTDGSLGASIAFTHKEILTITAKHTRTKHYHDTGTNICHACFNTLDTHVNDAYKTAPLSSPNTVGWNASRRDLRPIDDDIWKTHSRRCPPKQPHVLVGVQSQGPTQTSFQTSGRLPRNSHHRKSPLHHPTVVHERCRLVHAFRCLCTQHGRLGVKARRQPNLLQSPSLHPGRLPTPPGIRRHHRHRKRVHHQQPIRRPCS